MSYSVHELLNSGVQRFGNKEYIFERHGDSFCGRTFSQFADDVRALAAALLTRGLAGKNIILYGENSYNYMITDIAVMGYVGVSATLSKEWQPRDLINAAELLEAAAVIYSPLKEDNINVLRERFPDIQYIRFDELSELINEDNVQPEPLPTDICCKIIFSSGTTGMPKAVMLSQDNMFAYWDCLKKRSPFTSEDKDYLFLPLSHTYGGICNFLYSLISGMSIYICSDTKLIMEELQMVKPTVFCSVPLIYEKLYAACKENNIPPAAALGGNIRYLFSGGAYLRPEIREFLKQNCLNLLEAYGLTETSSLISCEYTNADDFDSVGTVLENMDIMIAEPDENGVGEILVRGGNVFAGYYNDPSATSAALSEDGWFRTGDLGFLDGRKLYLKGRKRRMILLSNGENVYPDELEALFAGYPQLNKVKVYERDGAIHAALFASVECDGEQMVGEVNEKLPKYAKIRGYEVIRDNIEARMK